MTSDTWMDTLEIISYLITVISSKFIGGGVFQETNQCSNSFQLLEIKPVLWSLNHILNWRRRDTQKFPRLYYEKGLVMWTASIGGASD